MLEDLWKQDRASPPYPQARMATLLDIIGKCRSGMYMHLHLFFVPVFWGGYYTLGSYSLYKHTHCPTVSLSVFSTVGECGKSTFGAACLKSLPSEGQGDPQLPRVDLAERDLKTRHAYFQVVVR